MAALGVGLQHRGQCGHHVLHPLHGLGIWISQGLLHAAELAVQHLTAQQVPELLEGLRRRTGLPLVISKLPDGLCRVRRQRIEFGLAQPCLVGGVGEELGTFLADSDIEQCPGLLQDAIQPPAAADRALLLADPPEQIVQALMAGHALAQQVAQRLAGIGPGQH